MRNNILAIACMAVIAAVGCSVQDISPEKTPEKTPETSEAPGGYKVLTIKASQSETKTAYAGEVTFSWCQGDKISVLCNDGESNIWETFTAESAAKVSSFSATVPANVNTGALDGTKAAMYPADEGHVYTNASSGGMSFHIPATRDFRVSEGGHKETAIPMFAWGTPTDSYAFTNLTGAVKFTFTNVPCQQVKFTFRSYASKLNGTFPIRHDNQANARWDAADPASDSEKPVEYYGDVENDGTVCFYVPFATGSIWGHSQLELRDVQTDMAVFTHNAVGTITVTRNQITVLPELSQAFKSAYGIDWDGIQAATVSDGALKTMKATADDTYIYLYLEADPSGMCRTHDYDCRFHFYKQKEGGSVSYWSPAAAEIDPNDKWGVRNGNIYYSVYGSTAYASNLLMHPDTWYYEIRIARSADSDLLAGGTVKLGVMLDDVFAQGSDPWARSNGSVPYGIIPASGGQMYSLDIPVPVQYSFTEASGEVTNPERGMMSYAKFTFTDNTIPATSTISINQDYPGESLAFLLFYMPDFIDKDLSDNALTFIRAAFDKVRAAGKKAVVRFAYKETYSDSAPQEARPSQILSHIDQVEPILSDNSDIIYILQAGWLGTYGEWYYKTNNHSNSVPAYTDYYEYTVSGSTVTDFNNNHTTLLNKLLTVVPSPIQIGLRTAFYKRYFLSPSDIGHWDAISSCGTSDNQRLALFNDGFRGDYTDVGTFNSQTDWDMWYSQGSWLACGGELSYKNATDFAKVPDDLKDCDNAIAELRRQHWSYLHYSTSNRFMVSWYNDGRFEDIEKALGYRLVLGDVEVLYSSMASGAPVSYSMDIRNTGSAAVVYPRPFKLVLLHNGSPVVLADLGDVTALAPGADAVTLTGSFSWPQAVVAGDKLAIWLPDRSESLQGNDSYSIRLANNETTWESGCNVIHTF